MAQLRGRPWTLSVGHHCPPMALVCRRGCSVAPAPPGFPRAAVLGHNRGIPSAQLRGVTPAFLHAALTARHREQAARGTVPKIQPGGGVGARPCPRARKNYTNNSKEAGSLPPPRTPQPAPPRGLGRAVNGTTRKAQPWLCDLGAQTPPPCPCWGRFAPLSLGARPRPR